MSPEPTFDILNLSYVTKSCLRKKFLIRGTLQSIKLKIPKLLKEMTEAIAQEDFDQLKNSTSMLHSCVSSITNQQLNALMLETVILCRNYSPLAFNMGQLFIIKIDTLFEEIHNYLKNTPIDT